MHLFFEKYAETRVELDSGTVGTGLSTERESGTGEGGNLGRNSGNSQSVRLFEEDSETDELIEIVYSEMMGFDKDLPEEDEELDDIM